MTKGQSFPLFFPCEGQKVLVIGGGTVATRRVETLREFPFSISVVTLTATEKLVELSKNNRISLFYRAPTLEDFHQVFFCLLCTNSPETNEIWGNTAKKLGILQNQCDKPWACDFYFPAVVVEDPVVVGLSGDGKQHKKVAEARKLVAETLSQRK